MPSSSGKQRFIKNLSLLYAATFISKIFALIANIILIRRLGASIYGEFAFAMTFITYFTLIADSGLSPYGETSISKEKTNAGKIMGDIFSFNIVLSVVATILMLFAAFYIFKFGFIQRNMLVLISILPIIEAFGFGYAVKALEKNQILALSAFIGRSVYFLGILIFVINKSDYIFSILFFVIGALLASIIQFRFIIKVTDKIKLNFSITNFKYLLLNAMPFGLVSGLITIYLSLPVSFLKIFGNDKDIGYYYITYRLVVFIFVFFNLIGGAFIPIISDAIKNKDYNKQSSILSELLRFIYTMAIPVCFGGFAISKLIILRLFGSNYLLSSNLLKIMVWSILFVAVSSIFVGFLTALNDKKSLISAALAATLTGFIASFLLIRQYGVYGGAISNDLIEFTMSLCLSIFAFKYIKIRIDILNLIKVLIISAITAITVKALNYGLIFSITSGILIYGLLSLVFKTLRKDDILELKNILSKTTTGDIS